MRVIRTKEMTHDLPPYINDRACRTRAALLAAWGTDPGGPPDFNNDGTVGILDLLALLAVWGTDPGGPPDFDGDGNVGILDLLTLLANWGPCP